MRFLTLLGIIGFALSLGCAHHKDSDQDTANAPAAEPGKPSDSSVAEIKKRAGFELACAEDQLQVTVLETGNMFRPWTFGVAGCGKRATYLYRAGSIVNQSITNAQ
jgi:hypothetical protein